MPDPLRLLAVLAHPDDESLGLGGTLARYADEGVDTFLITATRGERGRYFHNRDRPSDDEVGRVREEELRAAARELGILNVTVLGYADGELDAAPTEQVVGRVVTLLRELRPHVVVSFGFDGAYGHPDHIAVSQLTTSAIVASADPTYRPAEQAHRVAKLYHLGWPRRIWDLYQHVFKRMVSVVDGEERAVNPWPEWTLTTRIDARRHWRTAWAAIQRHETQLAMYQGLDQLTEQQHAILWGDQHFCRVFSTVNSGRSRETDLFEGLR
ncbi:MAG: PIG-L family deacetylase [Gemmatimonadetes bacterium]|nr:PIG-L family deacetylase [Gemmatimonadota bacterium]